MTTVPGVNLLRMARRLIHFEKIQYLKWIVSTDDAAGIVTPKYATPVTIEASVQPTPRNMYEQLGLDLQKNYFTVYASVPLRDLMRNGNCDMIDYAGRRLNVESNTDWFNADGWRGALCVDIGPTPP